MDKGAHFYKCDFQVHTPRDLRWSGKNATSDEERLAYGKELVDACRQRGIQAVAITDHHCMAFVPFIRKAAAEEMKSDGSPLEGSNRLIVFPGMELTLGVPCQALLIFDADFPDDMFSLATTALAITQNGYEQPKVSDVIRLDSITTLSALKAKLDEHTYLRGRYIILPNVTDEGKHSLLRNGQAGKYIEMACVGGYTDGEYLKLSDGTKNRLAGKDKSWGHKRIACIQTSDTRRDDHTTLGVPSTWIKWAQPSAEALRQACLAQESRICLDDPRVPETYISSLSVSNSSFLGPLDIDLNPQYSALIGGRGTGKSTVLEYLRWTLCDQPPNGIDENTPNYQARRTRLISTTLKPHNATIQVTYILNGVPHIVRRSSIDGAVQMKIGSGDFHPCSEEDVCALLPIQAYSQKQLSDVSVRLDELTRFITAPIKADLDRLSRKETDLANRIRETHATRQRFRELSRILNNRVIEEQSVTEQANAIRASLAGLSDEDRILLEKGKDYSAANNLINGWKAGADTLRQKAVDFRQIIQSQTNSIQSIPNEPREMKSVLEQAKANYSEMLNMTVRDLDRMILASEVITNSIQENDAQNPWTTWDVSYASFQKSYTDAVQRSSSHTEKLQQLRSLEDKIAELSKEATKTREMLATLVSAEANFLSAREEWLNAQIERDNLIGQECAALTERSGGLIRVQLKRHSDCTIFLSLLKQGLSGSRVQSTKLEGLGAKITEASEAMTAWDTILDELEKLADYDPERSRSETRPSVPTLQANGFTTNDVDRVAQTLKPDDWLSLSLAPIESTPVYEFRSREAEYIPFENASAGQQATALLKTLLNQPGPPLIIDQPEEDLDNPVMLEIVEQLWEAKQLRQIIFASHNANLVVNGDAELVAWFGYRTASDQSRGTIKGIGAIDIPDAREAIKQIMEGGEAAFRLRREKYGF